MHKLMINVVWNTKRLLLILPRYQHTKQNSPIIVRNNIPDNIEMYNLPISHTPTLNMNPSFCELPLCVYKQMNLHSNMLQYVEIQAWATWQKQTNKKNFTENVKSNHLKIKITLMFVFFIQSAFLVIQDHMQLHLPNIKWYWSSSWHTLSFCCLLPFPSLCPLSFAQGSLFRVVVSLTQGQIDGPAPSQSPTKPLYLGGKREKGEIWMGQGHGSYSNPY